MNETTERNENATEPIVLHYGINSTIGFGKYKGETVGSLLKCVEGRQYLNWAIKHGIMELDEDAEYMFRMDNSDVMACNSYNYKKVYAMNDVIDFGKYKGETVDSLFGRDDSRAYLRWLDRNYIICLDWECQKRLNSYLGDGGYSPCGSQSREYCGWDDEGLACGVLESDCY